MATPVTCRLCRTANPYEPEPVEGVCTACREKLGLTAMPPERRPRQPCIRCNGMRFVRAIPREYTAYESEYGVQRYAAPMYATAQPELRERWLLPGNEVSEAPMLRGGRGLLELYICLGCGFVEWYCHDVEAIPIGPEYNTAIVDYGSQGPYR